MSNMFEEMVERIWDDNNRDDKSDNNGFKVGEYIVYVNGDRFELGRIKRITDTGAFVCYHEGETAAKTPFDCMHKLANGYTIKETSLGGSTVFQENEDV